MNDSISPKWFLSRKRPKEVKRVARGHSHERVGESPGQYENFGTSGSPVAFFSFRRYGYLKKFWGPKQISNSKFYGQSNWRFHFYIIRDLYCCGMRSVNGILKPCLEGMHFDICNLGWVILLGNLAVWALSLNFLHVLTSFVIDIHQIMLISLFPTPFGHFQFLGSAGRNPKLILTLCHIEGGGLVIHLYK